MIFFYTETAFDYSTKMVGLFPSRGRERRYSFSCCHSASVIKCAWQQLKQAAFPTTWRKSTDHYFLLMVKSTISLLAQTLLITIDFSAAENIPLLLWTRLFLQLFVVFSPSKKRHHSDDLPRKLKFWNRLFVVSMHAHSSMNLFTSCSPLRFFLRNYMQLAYLMCRVRFDIMRISIIIIFKIMKRTTVVCVVSWRSSTYVRAVVIIIIVVVVGDVVFCSCFESVSVSVALVIGGQMCLVGIFAQMSSHDCV